MADLKPPFTAATAAQKVKAAQNLWNTRDPARVAAAYTPDSIWRNRDQFFSGTAAIQRFLERKWARELDYRLRKELFAFGDDRIAVQFWYEYRVAAGGGGGGGGEGEAAASGGGSVWRRAYGLEDWTFTEDGKMRKRQMSANEIEIGEEERWFRDGVDVDLVEIGEKHW